MEDVASKCGAGERGRGEAGGVSEFGFWLRKRKEKGLAFNLYTLRPLSRQGADLQSCRERERAKTLI